jgi:hypothetical protein
MFSNQIPIIEGLDCNTMPTNGNTIIYSNDYLNACVINKYNHIVVNKERELDEKLMELEKTKDSIYVNDTQGLYDSEMMIGITCTILGSCVLLYILNKISR